jgi:hypothetical protein
MWQPSLDIQDFMDLFVFGSFDISIKGYYVRIFIFSSSTYSTLVTKLLGSRFEQNKCCKDLNL